MGKISSAVIVVLSFVVLVSVFSLMMGCEGEQGPTGAAGATGATGPPSDGSGSCGSCHDVTTTVKAKQMQWELSKHATGGMYVRGTSATCAPCHSNEGFRQKIAGLEVTAAANPTPQNCRTCHNIHKTYSVADFERSTTAPVELTGSMYTGTTIDIGQGNLCANCHQTRYRDYGLEVGGPDVEVTSTHWGPHYGTHAPIFTGNNGFEIPGSLKYENSPMTEYVTDGCVTCHMGEFSRDHRGGHTLHPNLATCEGCHGDLDSFDRNGVQTEIIALTVKLRDILIADGLLAGEGDDLWHDYHPVVQEEKVSSDKAGALFNYRFVSTEGSHGVHNTKYTRALLQNSIEVFE